MHASKMIDAAVQRKSKDMVNEAKDMARTLSPHAEGSEADRLQAAVEFLEKAQEAMLEGFSAVLDGTRSFEAGRRASRDGESASDRSDPGKRFNPMELLERFDAETVGKGLDVVHSFVKVLDDLKKRKRT